MTTDWDGMKTWLTEAAARATEREANFHARFPQVAAQPHDDATTNLGRRLRELSATLAPIKQHAVDADSVAEAIEAPLRAIATQSEGLRLKLANLLNVPRIG